MRRLILPAATLTTTAILVSFVSLGPALAEKGDGLIFQRSTSGQPDSQQQATGQPAPVNFLQQLFGGANNYASYDIDPQDPDPLGPAPGKNPDEGFSEYQPERLVPIADAQLHEPIMFGAESRALYGALRDGKAGVSVPDNQRRAILAFYGERRFSPLWTNGSELTSDARTLLEFFARADEDGLEPRDYLPPVLGGGFDKAESFSGDVDQLAVADIEITALVLRYARHASGGRIIPNRMSGYYDITPPTIAPSAALTNLASASDPVAFLESLEPTLPAYAAMKEKLAELRGRSAAPDTEPEVELQAIPAGPRVKLGERDPRIPLLRKHLAKLGLIAEADQQTEGAAASQTSPAATPVNTAFDAEAAVAAAGDGEASPAQTDAPAPQAAPENPDLLDAQISEALKTYQKDRKIKVTGALDKATIAALGGAKPRPADETPRNIARLILNMERLRWLPRDLGPRYIFANQAAFELRVLNNGEEEWRTRVIVGKPDTQTFVFNDEMELVVFNPTWGVPGSIISKEMLPELLRDPAYLDKKGFEVTDAKGQVIPSRVIDWTRYAANGRVPFGVRQPAGGDNALGEVKFLFPNAHDIYMHDTPTRDLFKKDMRAFSHGCVRVQDPRHFAEVVLGWDGTKVARAIESRQSQTVPLPQKIPVYLNYFTAWPDESGAIVFYDDIYGRDTRLEKALAKVTAATL